MRKGIALIIIIAVALIAIPAKSVQAEGKSYFQRINDRISGMKASWIYNENAKPTSVPENSFFQSASETIAEIGKSSPAVKTTSATGEKTLFQIVHDSIVEADAAREKHPWNEVTVFENAKAKISDLDGRVGETKNSSLRENKGEVARRRSVK